MKESVQNAEQSKPYILIVEDDERLANLTKEYMESNGMTVGLEMDGRRAIDRIVNDQPDLVVLDVMLPGVDGMNICRQVRPKYRNPILMLTARTDDVDQVLGLEMGADDYVAKPVRPRILLARIRALLRRNDNNATDTSNNVEPAASRLLFSNLMIDHSAREVTLQDQHVELTSAEFDLLWLLASNAGKILSREEIFEQLRGIPYDGQDRSIDVRVSRVRPKIGDDPIDPRRIKTVRSKGYLFVKDLTES
ncbi:MAG TPA: response regulator [Pseudomonadales bacterium]